MKDSETQRQECSEEYDYREAARFLSEYVATRNKEEVVSLFSAFVHDLRQDRYIEQKDVEQLSFALEAAQESVQVVAAAQAGTHPVVETEGGSRLVGRLKSRRCDGGATDEWRRSG